MRGDLQDIFKMTPHEKQVMMFSATLSKEIRPICKKFMANVSSPSFRRGPPSFHSATSNGPQLRHCRAAVHWGRELPRRGGRGSQSPASGALSSWGRARYLQATGSAVSAAA